MTVSQLTIDDLLSRVEGSTIDFKMTSYDFAGQTGPDATRKRAEFVKDIVAMYNTPRRESAYIVLGIKKHLDGTYDVVGVKSHVDDAELQSRFNEWVYPIPKFSYEPLTAKGQPIAIIEIPPIRDIGPCLPLRDLPNPRHQVLRKHQLYSRRGSTNAIADHQEQQDIYRWFKTHAQRDEPRRDGEIWDELLAELHDFDQGFHFGLVTSQYDGQADDVADSLGLVNWDFVIDFDQSTDTAGLLSQCGKHLQSRRTIHLLTREDSIRLPNFGRATYWYCASGLTGRSGTIPKSDQWIEWNKMYGMPIQQFITAIAAATAARPVVLVAIWNEEMRSATYLNSILSATSASLADAVHTVLVTPEESASVHQIASMHDAKVFAIPIHQFCLGIRALANSTTTGHEDPSLPSSSGAKVAVTPEKWTWLAEELHIVHLLEGHRAVDSNQPGKEFLRGNEITWYDLGLNYDAPRTILPTILTRVRRSLGLMRPLRLNLFHSPGAGGTTVARRVIWDLHADFPCALLRRTVEPIETRERVAYLARITGLPVLLVVDAGAITDREADSLYEHIASAHLPVVLLQVIRRYGTPPQRSSLYLDAQLDDVEAQRFVHFLQREMPTKQRQLEEALRDGKDGLRTPFLLALVAFGRDFVRLPSYVSRHLCGLTEVQKQCVVILAIAHYYGQRSVPTQMFAHQLGLPMDRPVDLQKVLPETLLDILVETSPGYWRTAHTVIAQECMRQVLGPPGGDDQAWRYQLSNSSERFIEFCEGIGPVPPNDGLDLASRVFVFRGNSELIGSERSGSQQFSKLIEDIPAPEGRIGVLRLLAESFPGEAHFWAHLGRFYSIVLKDYDEAIQAIDQSITIQPNDHVLFHMKGMALRARVYDCITKKLALSEIADLAESASLAFAEARRINPDDEHGYISEVQMSLRVLDYCGEAGREAPILASSKPSCPQWIRECTETVEFLLARVREGRQGEEPSPLEQECRARLGVIYQDYPAALQRWDSILDRGDVYCPPVRRQIVWTHLARRGRNWTNLTRKELERIRGLLEANLAEEPNDERSLRLWLSAVRSVEYPPSVDSVIEKLSYWHASSDTVDPAYYLFVLYVLKVLDGSSFARERVDRYHEECRSKTTYRRNRTRSYEWIGRGEGLRRIVHQDALGDWDRDTQFWSDRSSLGRVNGVVARIQGPEAGEIEIEGGLRAFYVPGRAGHHRGEAENRRVAFFLGFSYDGLRAWDVQ